MEELCYSALDLAIIISGMDLGCQAKAVLLENIWEMERPFLEEIYRKNKRQLIMLWLWAKNSLLMLMWETVPDLTCSSKTLDCVYSMGMDRVM